MILPPLVFPAFTLECIYSMEQPILIIKYHSGRDLKCIQLLYVSFVTLSEKSS
jgi:hypothetical protein